MSILFWGFLIGAVAGLRTMTAPALGLGKDPPAAFIEDAVAILGALAIVAAA